MSSLIIALIIGERIVFSIVGLIAAIYGQVGWSVFMGGMIMILVVNTRIKAGVRQEVKNEQGR